VLPPLYTIIDSFKDPSSALVQLAENRNPAVWWKGQGTCRYPPPHYLLNRNPAVWWKGLVCRCQDTSEEVMRRRIPACALSITGF
jgi:hypothetical protein